MIQKAYLNSWVDCPRPNPQAKLRLFCFPYAGGGVSLYRSWADSLPLNVELCLIQLPGRERRIMEPPFSNLGLLLDALENALNPYMTAPFAFFGHSMGALIGFEFTRYLRRRNLIPIHLFVSGHRAPHISDPNPPIHKLPDAAFVQELQHLDGTPKSVIQNTELMQLVLPTLRADFELCETYVYSHENPLQCSISAFGGTRDHIVDSAHLAAWRDQTQNTFTLHMLPGNHFFIYGARLLLLQMISLELERIVLE